MSEETDEQASRVRVYAEEREKRGFPPTALCRRSHPNTVRREGNKIVIAGPCEGDFAYDADGNLIEHPIRDGHQALFLGRYKVKPGSKMIDGRLFESVESTRMHYPGSFIDKDGVCLQPVFENDIPGEPYLGPLKLVNKVDDDTVMQVDDADDAFDMHGLQDDLDEEMESETAHEDQGNEAVRNDDVEEDAMESETAEEDRGNEVDEDDEPVIDAVQDDEPVIEAVQDDKSVEEVVQIDDGDISDEEDFDETGGVWTNDPERPKSFRRPTDPGIRQAIKRYDELLDSDDLSDYSRYILERFRDAHVAALDNEEIRLLLVKLLKCANCEQSQAEGTAKPMNPTRLVCTLFDSSIKPHVYHFTANLRALCKQTGVRKAKAICDELDEEETEEVCCAFESAMSVSVLGVVLFCLGGKVPNEVTVKICHRVPPLCAFVLSVHPSLTIYARIEISYATPKHQMQSVSIGYYLADEFLAMGGIIESRGVIFDQLAAPLGNYVFVVRDYPQIEFTWEEQKIDEEFRRKRGSTKNKDGSKREPPKRPPRKTVHFPTWSGQHPTKNVENWTLATALTANFPTSKKRVTENRVALYTTRWGRREAWVKNVWKTEYESSRAIFAKAVWLAKKADWELKSAEDLKTKYGELVSKDDRQEVLDFGREALDMVDVQVEEDLIRTNINTAGRCSIYFLTGAGKCCNYKGQIGLCRVTEHQLQTCKTKLYNVVCDLARGNTAYHIKQLLGDLKGNAQLQETLKNTMQDFARDLANGD